LKSSLYIIAQQNADWEAGFPPILSIIIGCYVWKGRTFVRLCT